MKNQASRVETFTIPPGEKALRSGLGNFFYFIESSGPLRARTNLDPFKPFDVGTGVNYGRKTRSFSYVEIFNENAEAVTLTLYRGFAQYIDRRLNAPGYRKPGLPTLPVPSGVISSGEITLEEFDSYAAIDPLGRQRKIIVHALTEGRLTPIDPNDDPPVPLDTWIHAAGETRVYESSQPLDFYEENETGGTYLFTVLGNVAPPPPPEISFLESMADFTAQASYVFPAASLGAPDATRVIIVGINARRNGSQPIIANVRIGGIGYIVGNNADGDADPLFMVSGLYCVVIPSGVSGDVIIDFDAPTDSCVVSLWRTTGLLSPADPASSFGQFYPLSGDQINLSSFVVPNGIAVAMAQWDGEAISGTWTGLTESFDGEAGESYRSSGAAEAISSYEELRNMILNTSANTPNRLGVIMILA